VKQKGRAIVGRRELKRKIVKRSLKVQKDFLAFTRIVSNF